MSKAEKIKSIKEFSKEMRKNILQMSLVAGANSSHFGGALSIVEIVSSIFCYSLKYDPNNPLWEDRDRFILSKGHACLAYYAALHGIGYIDKDKLKTFEQDGSDLLGHPVMNKKLGIEFSNGSLGMGLSLGIGLALSSKKKGKEFKVFTILGDGECNEGSVWEAAMAAPNFDLKNFYVFIDNNKFQQTGSNKDIMNTRNLKDKWKSFGWHVTEIDGHDIESIINFFDDSKNIKEPKVVVAKTIKGKGFSFSESNNDWHHSVLSRKLYEQGLKELE